MHNVNNSSSDNMKNDDDKHVDNNNNNYNDNYNSSNKNMISREEAREIMAAVSPIYEPKVIDQQSSSLYRKFEPCTFCHEIKPLVVEEPVYYNQGRNKRVIFLCTSNLLHHRNPDPC